MIIKKLEVAGLRVFEHAEFEFQPGMNLLVGVNGVGKSTVLDALRFCLSRILPNISASTSPVVKIEETDMRMGDNALKISCNLEIGNQQFSLLIHRQRDAYIEHQPGVVREETIPTPDIEKIVPNLKIEFPDSKIAKEQTLGIFFSTRRSIMVNKKPSAGSSAGGQAAAYAESFSINRDFNVRDAAEWYRVQEALSEERPIAVKHLKVLREAVYSFLPEFKNLHISVQSNNPTFMVEKGAGKLNFQQLSDGERGLISLVIDLSRRLSQANPELPDPLKEGHGIVLIDELDLHLHPKWQRTVVENLTKTFPKCQFIATTHSPQIIPSVAPEQVLLLNEGEVVCPDRTFGMDSNWILKFLMDADDRPEFSNSAIEEVEALIKDGNFKAARAAIVKHKDDGLEITEWSVFEARMARMEVLARGK